MTTAVSTTDGMRTLREFDRYSQARELVDRLSDAGFPVERARIVGTGIRTVEQVTGRMTTGRAAAAGAGVGAWLGLFVGLLFGVFTVDPAWLPLMLGSLLIGAFWGAILGFAGHWATRGRRDFSSARDLDAERYVVEVDGSLVDEAARLAGIA
jgi:hypothetical protein